MTTNMTHKEIIFDVYERLIKKEKDCDKIYQNYKCFGDDEIRMLAKSQAYNDAANMILQLLSTEEVEETLKLNF